MDNIQSNEALMVWIINYLSEKVGRHAILKGGMVLRLLDCPRYTNDLDYVFVPFRSKKEIVPLIEPALRSLDGIAVTHKLHSTSARFDVVLKNRFGTFRTQIEVNVSESCESEPLSTGDFALKHSQAPHIIRVMRFDLMLAHKLVAWNERRLIRDLYDAYFIHRNIEAVPDIPTLKKRLRKIHYAKEMREKTLPKKVDIEEFLKTLETEVANLTVVGLENELRDYLDIHQLMGLDKKMKIGLAEMIEKIRGVITPQNSRG